MSTSLELSYLGRLLLEACAFSAIAIIGIVLRQRGSWAAMAAVGGILALLVTVVSLEVFVEFRYLRVSFLSGVLLRHGQQTSEILAWTRTGAVVLIAAAFAACAGANGGSRRAYQRSG